MNVEIINTVASMTLGHPIDLKAVSNLEPSNIYFKSESNGFGFKRIVWRFKKATVAIFKSGQILCLGAKSVKQAKSIMRKVFDALKFHGFIINTSFNFKVLNIIAKVDFGKSINLEDLAVKLEKCIYEPEMFSGLIYKDESTKAAFIIFSNGKTIIAGLKSEEQAAQAAKTIENLLSAVEVSVSIHE